MAFPWSLWVGQPAQDLVNEGILAVAEQDAPYGLTDASLVVYAKVYGCFPVNAKPSSLKPVVGCGFRVEPRRQPAGLRLELKSGSLRYVLSLRADFQLPILIILVYIAHIHYY